MQIQWIIDDFLAFPESKFLVRIDNEFLHNSFNSTGLKEKIATFSQSYELIRRGKYTIGSGGRSGDPKTILENAYTLYGLLHARYLLTKAGLQLMYEKFQRREFQTCPRVHCKGCQCIPYGESDDLGKGNVKMYCPSCSDIYHVADPFAEYICDGAYFGPNWIHMFLKKYKAVIPNEITKVYVPKIFGFRICHSSDFEDYSDAEEEDETSM